MKKNLLIVLLALLISTNASFADGKQQNIDQNINQKACQNVFSLVNVDLSVMSPRGSAADVKIIEPQQKPATIPVNNQELAPKPCPCKMLHPKGEFRKPKQKTSLFRLDLLGIFKIQVL